MVQQWPAWGQHAGRDSPTDKYTQGGAGDGRVPQEPFSARFKDNTAVVQASPAFPVQTRWPVTYNESL